MSELDQCKVYGLRGQGNIASRGKYGKDKNRDLLYCHTCGKHLASTRASAMFGLHPPAEAIRQIIHHAAEGVGVRPTARFLGLDKDTVNRVILRSGEHCARVLSSLLTSLQLGETQLNELWTFVKKRIVLADKRTLSASMDNMDLDWRLWDAHLARKAPTAARSMRWLKAKFAICLACYDFIRPRDTLSRGEDRIFRAKTPAMAANVADHQWTFDELLAYPVDCK